MPDLPKTIARADSPPLPFERPIFELERKIAELRSIPDVSLNGELKPLEKKRDRLIEEVGYEVLGLGPLDPLLRDHDITDILVNGPESVYIEKQGRLHATDVRFRDDAHLMQVIDRIVSAVGRRVDSDSPMVDARLPDGSRVNAIVPPLALKGPCLSIRRFGRDPFRIENLMGFNSLTPEIQTELREQTRKLAKALNVVGLMNIQFAIQNGIIYVLEVNPRASRTAPFVSKATGVPIARIGASHAPSPCASPQLA